MHPGGEEEEELIITGVGGACDWMGMPHSRHTCLKHPLDKAARGSENVAKCNNCWCTPEKNKINISSLCVSSPT
jgi:hypothetical protein